MLDESEGSAFHLTLLKVVVGLRVLTNPASHYLVQSSSCRGDVDIHLPIGPADTREGGKVERWKALAQTTLLGLTDAQWRWRISLPLNHVDTTLARESKHLMIPLGDILISLLILADPTLEWSLKHYLILLVKG